ncbi:MAG: hypothetical protein L6V35_09665 [Alistipes putredinis]|nr:MAG: hypothetical protein L6V35_09665 [Alistipes putredinis]
MYLAVFQRMKRFESSRNLASEHLFPTGIIEANCLLVLREPLYERASIALEQNTRIMPFVPLLGAYVFEKILHFGFAFEITPI